MLMTHEGDPLVDSETQCKSKLSCLFYHMPVESFGFILCYYCNQWEVIDAGISQSYPTSLTPPSTDANSESDSGSDSDSEDGEE